MGRVVGGIPRGRQDDGRATPGAQAPGDLDAIDVGKPDVQQYKVGPEPLGCGQALAARGALTHDLEAVGFQERTCSATESGVIVDDENGLGHTHKMPQMGIAQKPR